MDFHPVYIYIFIKNIHFAGIINKIPPFYRFAPVYSLNKQTFFFNFLLRIKISPQCVFGLSVNKRGRGEGGRKDIGRKNLGDSPPVIKHLKYNIAQKRNNKSQKTMINFPSVSNVNIKWLISIMASLKDSRFFSLYFQIFFLSFERSSDRKKGEFYFIFFNLS